jgi:hypothetical protein
MYIRVCQLLWISGLFIVGGWPLVFESAKDLYFAIKHTSDLRRAQPSAQNNQLVKLLDFPKIWAKL